MVTHRLRRLTVVALLVIMMGLAPRAGAQCGSAVLGEKALPAVFQGITLGSSAVTRMWELEEFGTVNLTDACGSGCQSLTTSPLCDEGGNCTAVTGIEWLNAVCSTAGYIPQTSVLLLEAPTASDGGRWAAIKVGHNVGDMNFDLDAAAASICGPSCAALASSYVGGAGQGFEVVSAVEEGGTLTVKLAWTAPSPAGQALNRGGEDLISSYAVYFARSTAGGATPPVTTGEKTGWTRVADTDSTHIGGYSTNAVAEVEIDLGGSSEAVYFAVGLSFDGTGNPDADTDTAASSFISRGTLVYAPETLSTAPVVTSVIPAEGSIDGGNEVVISGTRLASGTTVTVEGNSATDVTYTSEYRLRVTIPAGSSAGAVDVMVANANGSTTLVDGYRYRDVPPTALDVDGEGTGATSDLNGVLEPGETVTIAPTWQNLTGGSLELAGHAEGLVGPEGPGPAEPTYTTVDTEASYGDIGVGASSRCSAGDNDCYAIEVEAPTTRPSQHWDTRFAEKLSTGETVVWSLHVGDSFGDVARSHAMYRFIETMLHEGVTAGCGGGNYCPGSAVTRAQMAVFLLKAFEGANYSPPPCVTPTFNDVPCSNPFAQWIEELAARGITSGCGSGDYCPASPVTRAQMAVFLLKTLEGSAYTPPDCVTPTFNDVPCSNPFARWIEELAARGITSGCGGGNYCPAAAVIRGQMAVFLTKTFDLALYGP